MNPPFTPPKRLIPFGKCPCGRWTFTMRWRRLNTLYVDDQSNWMLSCRDCYDEQYAYYEERWQEYYGGLL